LSGAHDLASCKARPPKVAGVGMRGQAMKIQALDLDGGDGDCGYYQPDRSHSFGHDCYC